MNWVKEKAGTMSGFQQGGRADNLKPKGVLFQNTEFLLFVTSRCLYWTSLLFLLRSPWGL